MQFTVRMNTDNDAFQPDPEPEIQRILDRIGDAVIEGETSGVCLDINGNTVGGWELVE